MKSSPAAAIFFLIFSPKRFVKMAFNFSVEQTFEENEHWQRDYPDRVLPQEKIDHIINRETKRTRDMRKALLVSVLTVTISLLSGFLFGKYCYFVFGKLNQELTSALQILGAIIILGATLNEIGWKLSSWSGKSFPEIINRYIFKFSYVIGTFLFIIPLGWK